MTVVEIWAAEALAHGSRGPLKLTIQSVGEPGPNEVADLKANATASYRRAYAVWPDEPATVRTWKMRDEEVQEPERIPDPEDLA